MTRKDLLRRLRKLARKSGLHFEVRMSRGTGSHAMVNFAGVWQAVPHAKGGDLKRPLLLALLRRWNLTLEIIKGI